MSKKEGSKVEDRKMQLYKKEMWLTLVFVVLIILMGHTATLFVIFPSWQGGSLWGFPKHYIIPLLTGWFGLTIVSYLMMVYCNRFDDEQEELNNEIASSTKATSSQRVVQAGKTVEGGK
jgi:hypothetical protein